MLNYIMQLNEFYSTIEYKPISANATSIYMYLLNIANKLNWMSDFKVANTILMSKCKVNNSSALQRARNELIVNGYIKYKKRNKSNRCNKIYNCRFIWKTQEKYRWTTKRTTERTTKRTSGRHSKRTHYHYTTLIF